MSCYVTLCRVKTCAERQNIAQKERPASQTEKFETDSKKDREIGSDQRQAKRI